MAALEEELRGAQRAARTQKEHAAAEVGLERQRAEAAERAKGLLETQLAAARQELAASQEEVTPPSSAAAAPCPCVQAATRRVQPHAR